MQGNHAIKRLKEVPITTHISQQEPPCENLNYFLINLFITIFVLSIKILNLKVILIRSLLLHFILLILLNQQIWLYWALCHDHSDLSVFFLGHKWTVPFIRPLQIKNTRSTLPESRGCFWWAHTTRTCHFTFNNYSHHQETIVWGRPEGVAPLDASLPQHARTAHII